MFGVLIESKAGRQRRRGGALMSLLVHGSLIAAAIAATTQAKTVKAAEAPPTPVVFIKPSRMPHPLPPNVDAKNPGTYVPKNITVIVPPIHIDNKLPPISVGPRVDDLSTVFVGGGPITHDSTIAGRSTGVADRNAILVPDQVEKVATLKNAVRPTYPEVLRMAGVGGRVVLRFVVDTLGLVERETVVVREASHARFENAVRDVLPRMRFTPAQLDGHPVRMLVEMPFEF